MKQWNRIWDPVCDMLYVVDCRFQTPGSRSTLGSALWRTARRTSFGYSRGIVLVFSGHMRAHLQALGETIQETTSLFSPYVWQWTVGWLQDETGRVGGQSARLLLLQSFHEALERESDQCQWFGIWGGTKSLGGCFHGHKHQRPSRELFRKSCFNATCYQGTV